MGRSTPFHHQAAGSDRVVEVVYTPDSPMREPAKLVHDLLADVWASRELIWILFARDLKAMYRQSYLGYAWIFAPPLASTAVWLFLNSQRIVQVSETPIPYPAYVLVGTTLWTTFSSALLQPLNSFNQGRFVFQKLNVPPESFVAAAMARVVFDLCIRLLLLVPVFVWLGMIPPAMALLFPVAVACLLLLAAALGVVLVPIGALYTDIAKGLAVLVGFFMYLAPVVYPPAKSGWAAVLINCNPVTPVIMTARDWLTIGSSDYAPAMFVVAGCSAVVLFVGMVVLRVVTPHLVARMGM